MGGVAGWPSGPSGPIVYWHQSAALSPGLSLPGPAPANSPAVRGGSSARQVCRERRREQKGVEGSLAMAASDRGL